jgi:GTPase SAR1 family protein
LDSWLTELRYFSNPNIKIILIGNKNDLESKRVISYEEGVEYQKKNNLDYFTETSAKSGYNISELFINSTKLLYNEYLKYKGLYNSSTSKETKNSTHSFKLKNKSGRLSQNVIEHKESEEIDDKSNGCSC